MKIVLENKHTKQKSATNYYFITDLSGSMSRAIDHLKQTLSATKGLVGPDDTFSLGWFSSYNQYDWILKGAKVGDNLDTLINRNIYSRNLTCYTQILATLGKVVEDVSDISGHRNNVLYFLTDGWPNHNSPEKEIYSHCTNLADKFVEVRVIGYSSYYNREILLNMAEHFNGSFNHITDFMELDKSYKGFVASKPDRIRVELPKKYDLVWQVTDRIANLPQNSDNSVSAFDTGSLSQVFALDWAELENISPDYLDSGDFVYSCAYVLSQKNKANLAVRLLKQAGDHATANMLRSSFTVTQKGKAENALEKLAAAGKLHKSDVPPKILLKTFLADIEEGIKGDGVFLDTENSRYNSVTKKGNYKNIVNFSVTDKLPCIIDVVSNENRANISFRTVVKGAITGIADAELAKKVEEYNKAGVGKPIQFPISTETYKTYTFVSDGDFNFDSICLEMKHQGKNKRLCLIPDNTLEVFDETVNTFHIRDFVNLNKALIKIKAHASTLAFFIKNNSEQKHLVDWRVENYGKEAVPLLEAMGLDYAGRYSPKVEKEANTEDSDFIPFLEIEGYLKGASKVSASESHKKWLNKAKAKMNPADELLFPLFDKYEELLKTLPKEIFVKTLQTELEGVQKTVKFLSREIASMKFYVMTTNSWFEGVDKADKFEYDDFVVKISEQKEYI